MKFNRIFIKLIALFSVVRGYNLILLAIAEYLAALFIFSPSKGKEILLNTDLNFIIIASISSVAAGYIINNFYDIEKDEIDKPLLVYINRFIPDWFKLTVYLTLNFSGIVFAFFVSYRVAIFFFTYQFLVWLYSHKINRILVLNNLLSVILRILPFFALLIYYNNYSTVIFFHAGFLLLLLLILEIVKDLSSKPADLIFDYKTLPIVLGNKKSKIIIGLFCILTMNFAIILAQFFPTGFMAYYFYFSVASLFILWIALWKSLETTTYKILVLFLKVLILIGVFSIIFIKINPLDLHNIIPRNE